MYFLVDVLGILVLSSFNINNETGKVYHRFFYPEGKHLNMHIGKGADKVYFFK